MPMSETRRRERDEFVTGFAARLREAIRSHPEELTYREVADLTGMHFASISDLAHGRSQPTLYAAVLLADALGVPLARLAGIEEGADPPN